MVTIGATRNSLYLDIEKKDVFSVDFVGVTQLWVIRVKKETIFIKITSNNTNWLAVNDLTT